MKRRLAPLPAAFALAAVRALASAPPPPVITCPPDTTVECDGMGNTAAHDAWLNGATAAGGCGTPLIITSARSSSELFAYPSFCPPSLLQLNADATITAACRLRLSSGEWSGGSAFRTDRVDISCGASFTSTFRFQISASGGPDGGADGLVFVVGTDPMAMGFLGGYMGYGSITPSVGVEFDTYPNFENLDPDGNHIGIDVDGSMQSIATSPVTRPMNDGDIWEARIVYNGTAGALTATVRHVGPPLISSSVSAPVDFRTILGRDDVVLGFTSATASGFGTHEILNWATDVEWAAQDPPSCVPGSPETRRFTATDPCGSFSSCCSRFMAVDTLPPAPIGPLPADTTVQCDAVPPGGTLTFHDVCTSPDRVVIPTDTRTNGSCPDNYTIARTWTSSDNCGNTGSYTQTITVRDTVAPTLSGCPASATVECSAVPPPPPNPTVTDNCDPAPSITFTEVRTNGSCLDNYTLTRTWTAKDRCNNSATCSQVLTVRDTTPPVLAGCPANATVECSAVPPPPPNPAVIDNCDPTPSITFTEARTNGSCLDNYTLTRTWIAKDRCNNSSSCSQTLTVRDTTPPVLAGCPANATVECNAVPPQPPNPAVTDNCDPAPSITFTETRTNGSCADNYTLTRTWIAKDRCNNSSSCSQTLTVRDTTPPVLAGCPANATVECSAVPPQPPDPAVTDNCDPAPSVTFTELRTNGICLDNYTLTRTWIAKDRCNNSSSCSQTLTVRDTTPPVLAGCPANATVECSAVPPALPGPVVTDNCDPAPSVTFTETRTNGSCPDNYTLVRTWIAKDRCNNSSSCSQTLTVRDTTPPVLAGCPANATVECSAVPPAVPGPVATDNCDPAPSVTFTETRANGTCADNYTLTRTWIAKDRCNNSSSCSQTLTVRDTTPPVLSGCPGNVTVECDAVPPPAHPVVTDNCDPAPSITFGETRANGSCANNYTLTRTWIARDRCSNSSSCVQVVTVRDTTAPVIRGPADPLACLWPANHKYVCFNHFTQLWTVSDNCSAVVTLGVNCVSDQCDDAPCPGHPGENGDGSTINDCVYNPVLDRLCVRSERAGTNPGGRHYTVTLTATDGCGNSSSGQTTIYVPHDQSPHEDCIKPPHGDCCAAP